jgi:myo-inositol 2-dehydrogenase / D-chiro-inositol 1-dehydrogenase
MRKALKVGVIGCGRVTAFRHLPALSRLEDAEVVALADSDAGCLKHVADRFHVPNRFPDLRTLLDTATVDIIAVCVPVQSHAGIALAALDAGKHVFIEKPLTVTLEEADLVHERAKQVNRKVLVGFNFRWHRLILQARALLRRGAVGQVETIRTVFASAHDAPSAWQMHRASGGGALFDQAVHVFDLWRFLLESEVEEVFATSRSGPWDDETVTVTARFTNGVLATATCTERTGENNEVEVYGRRGRLQVSCYRFDGLEYFPQGSIPGNGRGRIEAFLRTMKELPGSLPRLRHGGDVLASYHAQWRHFLGAIRDDRPLDCTVADGRRALEVVFAAMASASSRRPVMVAQAPHQVTPISKAFPTTGIQIEE